MIVWLVVWLYKTLSFTESLIIIIIIIKNKERLYARKNVIDGSLYNAHAYEKPVKTNSTRLNELRVNDYGYNESTICLVAKTDESVPKGWFSSVGARTGAQWLALEIGGADFLHCLVADCS